MYSEHSFGGFNKVLQISSNTNSALREPFIFMLFIDTVG